MERWPCICVHFHLQSCSGLLGQEPESEMYPEFPVVHPLRGQYRERRPDLPPTGPGSLEASGLDSTAADIDRYFLSWAFVRLFLLLPTLASQPLPLNK